MFLATICIFPQSDTSQIVFGKKNGGGEPRKSINRLISQYSKTRELSDQLLKRKKILYQLKWLVKICR